MGQFWSKLDSPSTSNSEKFSNCQIRRSQLRKTSYVKKILNRRKVSKKRPTISSPHQANPSFLNGHKWRHVIITMPSKDQPPLPPQRHKRKMKPSTCLVVQRTSCKMISPVHSSFKFESHVKLFQTLITIGLAAYLPILRGANLQSNYPLYSSIDHSSSKSEDSMAMEEHLWHPVAARHRTKRLAGHKRLQPRFTVIRRKRSQPETILPTKKKEASNQPHPVPCLTKFWLKFKKKMRPNSNRMGVGLTMQSLAKKANHLCHLWRPKSLSSHKNVDNETSASGIVDFYGTKASFGLITSHEPADDSDCSISDSLSEFSCSL